MHDVTKGFWTLSLLLGAALLIGGCAAVGPAASGALVVNGRVEYRLQQAALKQRPAWIDVALEDAGGEHFLVGLSEYHRSERDAREDAMRHAREQFAAYTGVEVSRVDEVVRSLYGESSAVLDPTVAMTETSSQTTDAQVSRIKARQWYWEISQALRGGSSLGTVYKYWVLVTVPDDEFERVQAWKREEQAAELAQRQRQTQIMEDFLSQSTAAEAEAAADEAVLIAPLTVLPSVTAAARAAGTAPALDQARETLASQLTSALTATGAFQLRDGAASAVREGSEMTPEVLQLWRATGARYAFVPRIDGFEKHAETLAYTAIDRVAINERLRLSVVLLVIDLQSGALLPASPNAQADRQQSSGMVRPGTMVSSGALLQNTARELATELAQEVARSLKMAQVVSVTGNQLLINRGGAAGFLPGSVLEIFASRPAAADGQSYRDEIRVGRARVVRSDEHQSFAEPEGELFGVAAGFVVRLLPVETAAPSAAVAPDPREATENLTPGSSDKPLTWN